MTAPRAQVRVLPDSTSAAVAAAAEITRVAREAVAARGHFHFAVSGGRSPWVMLGALGEEMPWEAVSIYQVDERIGPPDDPLRNLTGLLDALANTPGASKARIVPMPVEADDLSLAAAQYANELPERFDLIHLGLGDDGHTASLIPGDLVLEVANRDVALTGIYQDRRRMTLTYPALGRARAILWLVTGAEKTAALHAVLAHDQSLPAGHIFNAVQTFFCDAAANPKR